MTDDRELVLQINIVMPQARLDRIHELDAQYDQLEDTRQQAHKQVDDRVDYLSGQVLKEMRDLLTAGELAGTGTWTRWYQSKGLTESQAKGRIRIADGYDSHASQKRNQLPIAATGIRLVSDEQLEQEKAAALDSIKKERDDKETERAKLEEQVKELKKTKADIQEQIDKAVKKVKDDIQLELDDKKAEIESWEDWAERLSKELELDDDEVEFTSFDKAKERRDIQKLLESEEQQAAIQKAIDNPPTAENRVQWNSIDERHRCYDTVRGWVGRTYVIVSQLSESLDAQLKGGPTEHEWLVWEEAFQAMEELGFDLEPLDGLLRNIRSRLKGIVQRVQEQTLNPADKHRLRVLESRIEREQDGDRQLSV